MRACVRACTPIAQTRTNVNGPSLHTARTVAVTHTAHTSDVADAVEQAMLDRFAVSFLYREKYRELAFNLRSNMTLRENVLCSTISPVSLVRMSSAELRRGCPVERRNEQEEKEEEEEEEEEKGGVRGDRTTSDIKKRATVTLEGFGNFMGDGREMSGIPNSLLDAAPEESVGLAAFAREGVSLIQSTVRSDRYPSLQE